MSNLRIKNLDGSIENFKISSTDRKQSIEIVFSENAEGQYTFTKTVNVLEPSNRINPSKVFKWIAEKLKKFLCPNCR